MGIWKFPGQDIITFEVAIYYGAGMEVLDSTSHLQGGREGGLSLIHTCACTCVHVHMNNHMHSTLQLEKERDRQTTHCKQNSSLSGLEK